MATNETLEITWGSIIRMDQVQRPGGEVDKRISPRYAMVIGIIVNDKGEKGAVDGERMGSVCAIHFITPGAVPSCSTTPVIIESNRENIFIIKPVPNTAQRLEHPPLYTEQDVIVRWSLVDEPPVGKIVSYSRIISYLNVPYEKAVKALIP